MIFGHILPLGPAVVGQHIGTPFALISLSHSRNLLMKMVTMLIGDSPMIFREEVYMGVKK